MPTARRRRDRHRVADRSSRLPLVVSTTGPPGDRHLCPGRCGRDCRGAARTRGTVDRGPRLGNRARLEPYAWPIPSLHARDMARLPLHGADWLLVGDAAGLVDPITREGIFFALQSAEFAASAGHRDRSTRADESRVTAAARSGQDSSSPSSSRCVMDAPEGRDSSGHGRLTGLLLERVTADARQSGRHALDLIAGCTSATAG